MKSLPEIQTLPFPKHSEGYAMASDASTQESQDTAMSMKVVLFIKSQREHTE